MKAFKGFSPELTSLLGDHKEETSRFVPGATMYSKESKTARTGYHCCENPFECLAYYAWDGKNRFWEVEARGDIDEDSQERISCTEIRLVKELTPFEFAYEGMLYMLNHPQRGNWQQAFKGCTVAKDEAEAREADDIAIARGEVPKAKGGLGSILGFIREKDGEILSAKLARCDKPELVGRWLTIDENREVIMLEEKAD